MPTIALSQKTYRRLLRRSTSFGDSPDDVIARLLDQVGEDEPSQRDETGTAVRDARETKPGSILPERSYWKPILEVLEKGGGALPANDAIEAAGKRMRGDLTPRDFEPLDTGEIRWRNRARFARLRMREAGLLSDTSRRGVWEITDPGRAFLRDA